MSSNTIELKTISELCSMTFEIPSYQRGYRWTRQQVKDLLEDVDTFESQPVPNSDEQTWYCLQPLVVKEDGEKFTVIDGQQRLTTIFIILKCLGHNQEDLFTISYQTRTESKDFLKQIAEKTQKDDTNIDYHFMLEAKVAIEEWKKNHENRVENLKDKLLYHCKVIWYPTDDNAYDVFKRLNSGKISLSNAELVKAVLLNQENFEGSSQEIRLRQLEMAGEWDRMEQQLHNNLFWYFVNPDPESVKYNATRIDFILEMWLKRELDKEAAKEAAKNKNKNKDSDKGNKKIDIDTELKNNAYYIFEKMSNKIKKPSDLKPIWQGLTNTFRTMKSWYDNREMYHYIGYLMNMKGQSKQNLLLDFLKDSRERTKEEFKQNIIRKIQKSIFGEKEKELNLADLTYGEDDKKIHDILLLFNLATTQNQISEQSRYPFDEHYKAAKKHWSLEHIHAQNERRKEFENKDVDKIRGYLKDTHKELSEYINKNNLKDRKTYNAVIGALMGAEVIGNKNNGFSSTFEKDDSLKNLALLQGDKNAAFNNKLYPEKKEMLAKWEDTSGKTLFVPICTRNVFFKHYSPNSTNPLFWDDAAGKEYLTAITETIANYIKVDRDTNEFIIKRKQEEK